VRHDAPLPGRGGNLELLTAADGSTVADGGGDGVFEIDWDAAAVEASSDAAADGEDHRPPKTMSRSARREAASRFVAEGRGHLRARRLGEARAAFACAGRLEPGSAAVQGGLGRVAFEQGRYAEAARHLERALASRPGSTGLRIVLGSAYLRMGKSGDARRQWERVLAQDPDNRAAKRLLDSSR
jgi:predicted Zn-dependent protease